MRKRKTQTRAIAVALLKAGRRDLAERLVAAAPGPERLSKALNDLSSAVIAFGRAVKGNQDAERMHLKLRKMMRAWEDEFGREVFGE